jgi:hypothetical protein
LVNPITIKMSSNIAVTASFSYCLDGNSDGVADCEQPHVATTLSTNDDYVTVVCPDGTELAEPKAVEDPLPDGLPQGIDFPYGFLDFAVNDVEPGGAAMVKLLVPDGASITTYYKYGPEPGNETPHWHEFMYDEQTRTGAKISGNEITLHFVDGQRGDDDLTANGIITDLGGPGSPGVESTTTTTATEGASGGDDGPSCFINTAALGLPLGSY